MSYPAILPTLPSFSPAVRRPSAPASGRHLRHSGQLVDWLRLAGRELLGASLEERIEPYLACSRCVARVQWCGGCGGGRAGGGGLDGITPLTPTVVLGAMADPYPPAELAEW